MNNHDHSLREIFPLIRAADNIVLYGDNHLFPDVQRFLRKFGKTPSVISATDFPRITDLPLERWKAEGTILIIASFQELLLAKEIGESFELNINKDFLLTSHVECAELGLWDILGAEFTNQLRRSNRLISQCQEIFSDHRSREMFNKVIYLKSNSLHPQKIAIDLLPVNPLVHNDYLREAENLISHIPHQVPDGLAWAIAFKLAIRPYCYEDKVISEDKNFIINCGAHNGSSSGMFAMQNPTATILGFEPQRSEWESHHSLERVFPNIKSINLGIWSRTERVEFEVAGDGLCGSSASRVGKGNSFIDVVSIDEYVTQNKVTHVDFIKMDIEGAEVEALKGAESVIRSFKPDLAIAVYHKASHLWEIPLLINTLLPEYRIFFDHKYGNVSESVCFATARH